MSRREFWTNALRSNTDWTTGLLIVASGEALIGFLFDSIFWLGLAMLVSLFAVIAYGCVLFSLWQLRRHEARMRKLSERLWEKAQAGAFQPYVEAMVAADRVVDAGAPGLSTDAVKWMITEGRRIAGGRG